MSRGFVCVFATAPALTLHHASSAASMRRCSCFACEPSVSGNTRLPYSSNSIMRSRRRSASALRNTSTASSAEASRFSGTSMRFSVSAKETVSALALIEVKKSFYVPFVGKFRRERSKPHADRKSRENATVKCLPSRRAERNVGVAAHPETAGFKYVEHAGWDGTSKPLGELSQHAFGTSASASPLSTICRISAIVSGATEKLGNLAAKRANRRMRTGSSANASLTCRSTCALRSRMPP